MRKSFGFEHILMMNKTQKTMIHKSHVETFPFFFLDTHQRLIDFCQNGPELPWASGGWINAIKLKLKMIENLCLGRVLTPVERQKIGSKIPHLQTFSFFFLDLKLCLTDFCQNDLGSLEWLGAEVGFLGFFKKLIKG